MTARLTSPPLCRRPDALQVLDEVCRMANYLRSIGVKKGDNVSIYMPMARWGWERGGDRA